MEIEEIESVKLLLIIGLLLTTFFTLSIIVFIVFYQRKAIIKESEIKILKQERELEVIKVSMQSEENERKKIAENIHDEINPMLALLKFNINRYKLELAKNKFNPDSFSNDENIIDQTIESLRSISMNLTPSFLIKNGLTTAIEDYIGQFKRSNLIQIKLFISDTTDRINLSNSNIQLHIYRMWLELFQNIIKHTGCNVITINLNYKNDFFLISFNHDGKGISDVEIEKYFNSSNGLGLKSIKARSVLLNATVNYYNHLANSSVCLSIPLRQ